MASDIGPEYMFGDYTGKHTPPFQTKVPIYINIVQISRDGEENICPWFICMPFTYFIFGHSCDL